MFVTFRSALLVIAALASSSVAPAQVRSSAAPTIAAETLPAQSLLKTASLTLPAPFAATLIAPAPLVEEDPAPSVKPSSNLAALVSQLRGVEAGNRELECLAGAVYFESKGEPLAGQLAVGHVIANRAHSNGRFPSSYCGVVFQRGQFSFVRGHGMPAIARGGLQWKNAVAIAKIVDQKLHASAIGSALFFHARRVSPSWHMTRVATLGNHIFYR